VRDKFTEFLIVVAAFLMLASIYNLSNRIEVLELALSAQIEINKNILGTIREQSE